MPNTAPVATTATVRSRNNSSRLSLHGLFPVKASSTVLRRGTTSRCTPARLPKADLGFRHRYRRRQVGLSSFNRVRITPADAATHLGRTYAQSQRPRQGRPFFLCAWVLATVHRRIQSRAHCFVLPYRPHPRRQGGRLGHWEADQRTWVWS